MNQLTNRDVENLKSDGRFFHAGALAAALGQPNTYGCHYGMRSSREWAIEEFQAGHAAALRDITKS
jgi:hypothetical protein